MSALQQTSTESGSVIVRSSMLEWLPGARTGVIRRELERGAMASDNVTSIVRFGPGVGFPRHLHHVGEEIFVLDGVFSDESGHFSAGAYLRNPAGTSHGPYSKDGCTILIKLLPGEPRGEMSVIVNAAQLDWIESGARGISGKVLLRDGKTTVTLERLVAGSRYPASARHDGEELFLIEGAAQSALFGDLRVGDWIRNPADVAADITTGSSAIFWVKRRHSHQAPPAREARDDEEGTL